MSSPPPPNPTTNITTTAAGTTTVDFFKSAARQRPRKHIHPSIYQTYYNPQQPTTPSFPPPPTQPQRQQPPPPQQHHPNSRVLYPVSSSGRGFVPKHHHPNFGYPYPVHRPYGYSNSDVFGQSSHQLVNPSSAHLQQTLVSGGGVIPAGATGVSVSANPKVVGQSSVADDKNSKNTRDKNGDDNFVIIRDRKVQVSEGTSFYAQCRSWLKNGFTLENQPQYVDCVKSLPKPLPASMVEARKEDDMEIEEKTEDVEHLSDKELLQQHVKHAKKVRARLRNQRLQRIERYKDRLALLLPPVVDQPSKNDPTS